MKHLFKIGEKEKHDVEVDCSSWTGKITVKVDGKEVVSKYALTGQARINIKVGNEEPHDVEIRVGGILSTTMETFIDGKIISSV